MNGRGETEREGDAHFLAIPGTRHIDREADARHREKEKCKRLAFGLISRRKIERLVEIGKDLREIDNKMIKSIN